MTQRLFLFDTTLRDGAQTRGVDFSLADKVAIAEALDRLGLDISRADGQVLTPLTMRFSLAPLPYIGQNWLGLA